MLRGLEKKHEQAPQQLLRDTRTLGQRIADFFKKPQYIAIVLGSMAAAGFFFPGVVDLIGITGIFFFSYSYTRKLTLPYRLPQTIQCTGS